MESALLRANERPIHFPGHDEQSACRVHGPEWICLRVHRRHLDLQQIHGRTSEAFGACLAETRAESALLQTPQMPFLFLTSAPDIIVENQVRMDPKKIAAVKDWTVPTTVKQLQSFLASWALPTTSGGLSRDTPPWQPH